MYLSKLLQMVASPFHGSKLQTSRREGSSRAGHSMHDATSSSNSTCSTARTMTAPDCGCEGRCHAKHSVSQYYTPGPYQKRVETLAPACFCRETHYQSCQWEWNVEMRSDILRVVPSHLSVAVPSVFQDLDRDVTASDWAVFMVHLSGVYTGSMLHNLELPSDIMSSWSQAMVLQDLILTWNDRFFLPRGVEAGLIDDCRPASSTRPVCLQIRVTVFSHASSHSSVNPPPPAVQTSLHQTSDARASLKDSRNVSVESLSVEQGKMDQDSSSLMETSIRLSHTTVLGPYEFALRNGHDQMTSLESLFSRSPDMDVPVSFPPAKLLDIYSSHSCSGPAQMPRDLRRYDVHTSDWCFIVEHVTQVLGGSFSAINLCPSNMPDTRDLIISDMVQTWNVRFFNQRGLELVLMSEEENEFSLDSYLEESGAGACTACPEDSAPLRSLIVRILPSDDMALGSSADSVSDVSSYGPAIRRSLPLGEYAPFPFLDAAGSSSDLEKGVQGDIFDDDMGQCDPRQATSFEDRKALKVATSGKGFAFNKVKDWLDSSDGSQTLAEDDRHFSQRTPALVSPSSDLSSSYASSPASIFRTLNVEAEEQGKTSPPAKSLLFAPPPLGLPVSQKPASRIPGSPVELPPLPKPWEWNV
jgi:hypothetical protein